MNECGTIPNSYAYGGYCVNRLPCGVCRELRVMCPIAGSNLGITWQSGPLTQATTDPNLNVTAWNSEGEK